MRQANGRSGACALSAEVHADPRAMLVRIPRVLESAMATKVARRTSKRGRAPLPLVYWGRRTQTSTVGSISVVGNTSTNGLSHVAFCWVQDTACALPRCLLLGPLENPWTRQQLQREAQRWIRAYWSLDGRVIRRRVYQPYGALRCRLRRQQLRSLSKCKP